MKIIDVLKAIATKLGIDVSNLHKNIDVLEEIEANIPSEWELVGELTDEDTEIYADLSMYREMLINGVCDSANDSVTLTSDLGYLSSGFFKSDICKRNILVRCVNGGIYNLHSSIAESKTDSATQSDINGIYSYSDSDFSDITYLRLVSPSNANGINIKIYAR